MSEPDSKSSVHLSMLPATGERYFIPGSIVRRFKDEEGIDMIIGEIDTALLIRESDANQATIVKEKFHTEAEAKSFASDLLENCKAEGWQEVTQEDIRKKLT